VIVHFGASGEAVFSQNPDFAWPGRSKGRFAARTPPQGAGALGGGPGHFPRRRGFVFKSAFWWELLNRKRVSAGY